MIAAISLIRRREDITLEEFRRHWLDPHGVMTAKLPGLRYYVQSHCIDGLGTNALARELAIDGFPALWFDSAEARQTAYTSPRMAECNLDSEHFIGSVSRLVTEPHVVVDRPTLDAVKVLVVAIGSPDLDWSERLQASIRAMKDVTKYVRHTIIDQAAAPASKIPELKIQVAGFAEVSFLNESALLGCENELVGCERVARLTAVYRVLDYQMI